VPAPRPVGNARPSRAGDALARTWSTLARTAGHQVGQRPSWIEPADY